MTVSEISKYLHVTPPSVTQLLKSLEGRGLIERHMDATDRRVIVVTLTRQGEHVTNEAKETISAKAKGLIEYLGEEQSNQLADLLFKVFHYFAENEANLYHEPWEGEKPDQFAAVSEAVPNDAGPDAGPW